MKNPLVSIVITLFNYEKYVIDCLGSCIFQTYNNIEIIVVDDCSTDGSSYKAKQMLRIYHKLLPINNWKYSMIYHEKNQGIAASKNTGIKAAKGELITFLDADDYLTPNSIEKRVRIFEKKQVDLVHGYAYKIGPDDTYDGCLKKRKKLILSGKPESINAQTTMYKREVFEKFGLFYEPRELHSKEDTEMVCRLGLHYNTPLPKLVKAHKIDKPTSLAFHRYHDNSAKNSRTGKQKKQLEKAFSNRINNLHENGINKSNTRFL